MTMSHNKKYFPKYFAILDDNRKAGYIQCKHISVSYNKLESTHDLWKKHNAAIKKKINYDKKPEKSLLDLKIEIASRIYRKCCLCERKCKVDRRKISGKCGVQQPTITSEFLHFGEESIFVPSYTVFFSGCTFNCVFCQNWDISQYNIGVYIKPENMVKMINVRRNQNAKNVNWVGGDPTPNLLYILTTLNECDLNLPQIWNSNMYCSIETMKLLSGIIDVYLTDFKYGNNSCAKRLSKIDNYLAIIKRNHLLAIETGDIIIRHLVMPNHIDCCTKNVINWISKNLLDAPVNIMYQYHPEYQANHYKEISRPISNKEILIVDRHIKEKQIHQI